MIDTGARDDDGASYAGLEAILDEVRAAAGAAEAHGILWGILGAAGEVSDADWMDEVMGPDALVEPGAAECRRRLEAVLAEAHRALGSDDYEFAPLLPEDTTAIGARCRALGRWCGGFLAGVGFAGGEDFAALSAEAREFLADLTEIARIEPDPAAEEESEVAYTEVVEFVRVGVMLMVEEPRGGERAG